MQDNDRVVGDAGAADPGLDPENGAVEPRSGALRAEGWCPAEEARVLRVRRIGGSSPTETAVDPEKSALSAAAAREPRVVITQETKSTPPLQPSWPAAWRALGWFGAILALIGFGDAALQWYPLAFQSPEWEFATVATSLGSLPLMTMGMAFVVASFLARGMRKAIAVMAVLFALTALFVLFAYGIFVTVVPMALKNSPPAMLLGIKKAIAKTSIMGIGFSLAYIVAAIAAFRHLRKPRRA